MSLQKEFAKGLELLGEHRVMDARSTKYWVYSRRQGGFYYLGKGGALRIGSTTKGSLPCSEAIRADLLTRARAQTHSPQGLSHGAQ